MESAFDVKFAFNRYTLGDDFCKETLGFSDEQLNDFTFNMLEALGFEKDAIDAANMHVCGSMTLEGAPHLKDEHLPVFDCANVCGRIGKRFLSVDSHITMMAAAQRVGNLMIIIDFNKWQGTGRSEKVLALSPLVDKWRAFGWDACEVDGHDMEQLVKVLSQDKTSDGKPIAIVAHTVKGKGVSFMEDDNNWHYKIPSAEEVATAHKELGVRT